MTLFELLILTIMKVVHHNIALNREQRSRPETMSLTKTVLHATLFLCMTQTCVPLKVQTVVSQTIRLL